MGVVSGLAFLLGLFDLLITGDFGGFGRGRCWAGVGRTFAWAHQGRWAGARIVDWKGLNL